jgi:hypothetical protein
MHALGTGADDSLAWAGPEDVDERARAGRAERGRERVLHCAADGERVGGKGRRKAEVGVRGLCHQQEEEEGTGACSKYCLSSTMLLVLFARALSVDTLRACKLYAVAGRAYALAPCLIRQASRPFTSSSPAAISDTCVSHLGSAHRQRPRILQLRTFWRCIRSYNC